MFIQTRIQLKLQEIPEDSSIVLGMEEPENCNVTGSRQQFGEKTKQLHKRKKS
jgi:hypothetical protein